MRRRGSGATHSNSPGDGGAPLPGTMTRRQELADGRGWSTFRKRGPPSRDTPHVERREAPRSERSEGTPSQSVPPGGFAGHPSGVSHTPASAGAPLPSRGSLRISNSHEGLPGADIRIRAMSHAWREAASPPRAGCLTIESVMLLTAAVILRCSRARAREPRRICESMRVSAPSRLGAMRLAPQGDGEVWVRCGQRPTSRSCPRARPAPAVRCRRRG